jgi:hypothetical protein
MGMYPCLNSEGGVKHPQSGSVQMTGRMCSPRSVPTNRAYNHHCDLQKVFPPLIYSDRHSLSVARAQTTNCGT